MKRTLACGMAALLLAGLVATGFAYEAITGPTGVLYYDRDKAYQGYTLLDPTVGCKTTYLIDMRGNVVHTWKSEYTAGLHSVLLPNGHLLRAGALPRKKKPGYCGIGGAGGIIEEFDWQGNKVWEYKMFTPGKEIQHHTFCRLPNGNTMILGWETMSKKDAIKAGRDPAKIPEKPVMQKGIPHDQFWMDFVREVNREGDTVWEWHVKDHLGKGPNKLDFNYTLPAPMGATYPNLDWSHFNTVNYIPETDTVVLNSRNLSEFYLVDHKTGEIKYRWGNPSAWDPEAKTPGFWDDGDQKVFGSHCATPLENGHILLFDNGSERPEARRSRAVEVDPKTGEIVWQFATRHTNSFNSHRQGAVQRLDNGNTFITSTHGGHIFEVTPEGEVVWEFISPIFAGKTKCVVGNEDAFDSSLDAMTNMVHRAHRYGEDYPAFYGKTLTPQGYICGDDCPRFYSDYRKGAALSAAPAAQAQAAAPAPVEEEAGDGPAMLSY
ncbi:MAG: aryl-sulfate sulfotransferase [Deltaproteobacteria bacterium]|nr:aryl-sulfate sulfotransferase [Deltaproteobacteria bacterium]